MNITNARLSQNIVVVKGGSSPETGLINYYIDSQNVLQEMKATTYNIICGTSAGNAQNQDFCAARYVGFLDHAKELGLTPQFEEDEAVSGVNLVATRKSAGWLAELIMPDNQGKCGSVDQPIVDKDGHNLFVERVTACKGPESWVALRTNELTIPTPR